MVFLDGRASDRDGLPSGYGFDLDGKYKEGDDEYSEDHERLPDVTVLFPNKQGTSSPFTHRFMQADYPESDGVKIVEGQTYAGADANSGQVIGKIGGALFQMENMCESLQMAGDCMTEEVYDAMCELFDGNGRPKGALKKKCRQKNPLSIFFLGGVFVRKDRRGQGLGLEIVRALIEQMVEEHFCDFVVLCPAADPNPGPSVWKYAFDSLAAMFEKMNFRRCGAQNRRTGQSMYMFLEPDYDDFKPPIVPVSAPPLPSATGMVASTAQALKVVSPAAKVVAETLPTSAAQKTQRPEIGPSNVAKRQKTG